ncbi:hypothetical protein ATZ36_15255 [Candidatus Endomicrobiellum trichonymphae]|uniref:Uncharacterized protein n=1 Tax=Endomicrobium trichonymphae TaxID=1408204 RepID=A0A1E5IHA2_ENDTX|nr:hypothetical protein ATZ36_07405 [Candidatus Endomicrobium trichonymphae]OEG71319.1 hypothetical protein ATZ36_15255 [Candidatus Endomicrobium trichonymphae]
MEEIQARQAEFEEVLGFKSPEDIKDFRIETEKIGDLIVSEERLEEILEHRYAMKEKILRAEQIK